MYVIMNAIYAANSKHNMWYRIHIADTKYSDFGGSGE